ncbi:MAG: hypothetical protein RIR26_1806, partial [Pseudomonadota bacterium]
TTVFLNLQNDHQARYKNMDEYLKAKWRLTLMTRPDGLAVVDHAILKRAVEMGLALPECRIAVSYGFLSEAEISAVMETLYASQKRRGFDFPHQFCAFPIPSYGELLNEAVETLIGERPLTHVWMKRTSHPADGLTVSLASIDTHEWNQTWQIPQPVLPGDHNQLNIVAASLPALLQGIHPNVIRSQWNLRTSGYEHLPHRLEIVGRNQKFLPSKGIPVEVLIVNDSKATNVESTLVAVKSFDGRVRLLLGGEPKGDSYTVLAHHLKSQIVKIYPFGKAAPLICEQLATAADQLAPASKTMTEAAQLALDESLDGDVVLLSPACASFDEFKNFEHRGDVFRQWALKRVSNG